MRNPIAIAVALIIVMATAADAQRGPGLEAGDRIRVRLDAPADSRAEKQTIVGELLAVTPDSLTVRIHPRSAPFTIAVAAIDRLERSYGLPTAGQGALWGGAYTGALAAVQAPLSDRVDDRGLSVEQSVLLGGAVGAVIGAAIGALRPIEGWERVPLPGEPAEYWTPIDVPRVTVSGGLGLAEREIGSGSGSHLQVGIGIARLPYGTQLRGELTYQATSTSGGADYCYPYGAGGCAFREDETRRYGVGLTLFNDLTRIGDRFRLLAPIGLGVVNSHISSMESYPYSCPVDTACPAMLLHVVTRGSDRVWGVMGNIGFHAAFRFGAVDAFAEVRGQIIGEAGSDSAVFLPLAIGVSF